MNYDLCKWIWFWWCSTDHPSFFIPPEHATNAVSVSEPSLWLLLLFGLVCVMVWRKAN